METLSQTNKQKINKQIPRTSKLCNINFMEHIYPQHWYSKTVSADLEFCSTGSFQSLHLALFSPANLSCVSLPHLDSLLFREELRQRGDHKTQNFKTKQNWKLILKKSFLHIHMCFFHTEFLEQKFKVDFHYFVCDSYYFTL